MTVPSIEALIGSTSQRLTPFRDYRMIRGAGESAYLSLFAPPQGQVLVTAATRVNHFNDLNDDLPTLGLPSRMKDCLVYYACWQLLSQRLPVGQEDLRLQSRQTEAGTENRSEVLDGLQTSTQVDDKASTESGSRDSLTTDTKDITVTTTKDGSTTEDKTPTLSGTRDSTTTEIKAAQQQEDTNLEQTEDKNGTLTAASNEVSSDSRSGSASSTTDETNAETQVQVGHSVSEGETIEQKTAANSTNILSDLVDDLVLHDTGVTTQQGPGDDAGVTTETTKNMRTTGVWDDATPAHQVSSTTSGSVETVDGSKKRTLQHTGGTEHTITGRTGETQQLEGSYAQNTSTDDKTDDQQSDTAGTAHSVKSDVSGESNSGTVTGSKTEGNAESNLILNVQEKVGVATEDNVTLFSETTTQGSAEDNVTLIDETTIAITDEDATSNVSEGTDLTKTEDNTIQVDQSTDNTTTSVFGTTKTVGLEAMATYRDRLQTAQYYKLLMDMEVQNKKMRSWVSRGL